MSSEIERYDSNDGCELATNGDYVKFSDHAAEIARLRAELQNAAKAALDATALACEKEREADVERADAERYRVIRRKVAIVGGEGKSEFRIINLDPRYVAPKASIELDAAIDAAMGEGK